MKPDLARAVELVEGDRDDDFGNCFCIDIRTGNEGERYARFATCAHVVSNVLADRPAWDELEGQKVKVSHCEATVIHSGDATCDVAILEVVDRESRFRPLTFLTGPAESQPFVVYGYQKGNRTMPGTKKIAGTVDSETWEGVREKYRRLNLLAARGQFNKGFSGSPVLDTEGRVRAMVTQHDSETITKASALDVAEVIRRKWLSLTIRVTTETRQESQRAKRQRSKVPRLLPFSADRTEPKDKMHAYLDEAEGSLLFTHISGPSSAVHDKFVEVFSRDNTLGNTAFVDLEWKCYKNSYTKSLYSELRATYSMDPDASTGLAELIRSVYLPKGTVFVLLDGTTDKLKPGFLDALTKWLDEWRGLEEEIPKKTRVVFCIAHRYEDAIGDWWHRRRIGIRNWRRRRMVMGKLKTVVGLKDLGDLEPVHHESLGPWIKEAEETFVTKVNEDYEEGDLGSRVEECFDTHGKAMSMKRLAAELKKILDSYALLGNKQT